MKATRVRSRVRTRITWRIMLRLGLLAIYIEGRSRIVPHRIKPGAPFVGKCTIQFKVHNESMQI